MCCSAGRPRGLLRLNPAGQARPRRAAPAGRCGSPRGGASWPGGSTDTGLAHPRPAPGKRSGGVVPPALARRGAPKACPRRASGRGGRGLRGLSPGGKRSGGVVPPGLTQPDVDRGDPGPRPAGRTWTAAWPPWGRANPVIVVGRRITAGRRDRRSVPPARRQRLIRRPASGGPRPGPQRPGWLRSRPRWWHSWTVTARDRAGVDHLPWRPISRTRWSPPLPPRVPAQ